MQANFNMPHPIPSHPTPSHPTPPHIYHEASTSWRKYKRTLTCPTPPHIYHEESTSWRKCKRTLTYKMPHPTPSHPTSTRKHQPNSTIKSRFPLGSLTAAIAKTNITHSNKTCRTPVRKFHLKRNFREPLSDLSRRSFYLSGRFCQTTPW